MNDFEIATLCFLMYIQGMILGYIIWAPMTTFKQGLLDGLTLKFLWGKK